VIRTIYFALVEPLDTSTTSGSDPSKNSSPHLGGRGFLGHRPSGLS
jgi:hypothetical protein